MSPEMLSWLGPTVVSIATVLSGIYAMFKWVFPRVRKMGHLIDDLWGEPERPGVKARPGIMERLEDTGERILKLELRTKELLPNSGSSMRDAVNRIEAKLECVDDRLKRVETLTNERGGDNG